MSQSEQTRLVPLPADQPCSGKGDLSDEDDENEFFDAPEIITVPENLGHR